MPLIYITGVSGSGKSAVRVELVKRGYKAFDTDEDRIAAFYNNETGGIVDKPKNAQDRSPEWYAHHTRSEEHTSELQSLRHLVCRLLLEKKKKSTASHKT